MQLIRTELRGDGVLVATIDMPDRPMNVFSAGLMDALDALMDQVDADPAVLGVVVTSGKSSFLAGADLVMVRGYTEHGRTGTHEELFEMCGRLGRQFVRLESHPKPWVAAVNGIALGGGLELAMACRERVVSDDRRILLGLPEVRWGLLPGAGGTQRLPRLVGHTLGCDLLLTGRSLDPATAVACGLFRASVPADQLLDTAVARVHALRGTPHDPAVKFGHLAQADVPTWSPEAARALALQHGIDDVHWNAIPAYSAICDSVLKGARQPLGQATATEMHEFIRLMVSPIAGRMISTLFLERLRAEKELSAPAGTRVAGARVGSITAQRVAWADVFARMKTPPLADAALPADTLVLVDAGGAVHQVALRVLEEPAAEAASPQAVLAPAGDYGRVIEVVGAPQATRGLLASLAAQLRCIAWPSPDASSVLARLRGQDPSTQARVAAAAAALRGAGDPEFMNVAACLSGVCTPWSGGPLQPGDAA